METAVFVFIQDEQGRVLCVTRPIEKAKYEGDFGLPGGIVEEGETLIDAMWREAFEEGIDVEFVNPAFIQAIHYPEKDLKVFWFLGKGKFTPGDYPEKERISQVYKTMEELSLTTSGNKSVTLLIP